MQDSNLGVFTGKVWTTEAFAGIRDPVIQERVRFAPLLWPAEVGQIKLRELTVAFGGDDLSDPLGGRLRTMARPVREVSPS